jgi:TonB family protein
MRRPKPIEISLFLSFLFHLALFFLFNSTRERLFSSEEIKEVSLIDQTYRPEVAKVLPPPKEGFAPPAGEGPVSVGGTGGGGGEEEVAYDLSKKLERSQAKIDFSRYETEEMGAIRIADKVKGITKTTEEILREAPIPLAVGTRRGSGGGLGITGYPGVFEEAPIKLETKPIEKREKVIERKVKEEASSPLPSAPKQSAIILSGPISERKILRKVLPRYPDWALKKGISGTIVIRLWVSPEGDVRENVEVVESSGYPDLDQAVVSALLCWKFAPLPENVKKENQWGLVTVRFVLL